VLAVEQLLAAMLLKTPMLPPTVRAAQQPEDADVQMHGFC